MILFFFAAGCKEVIWYESSARGTRLCDIIIFMEIVEDTNDSRYQIRAYRPGEVTINDKRYTKSLVVSNDALIEAWGPKTLGDITQEHIDRILALKSEIILLGTGEQFIIPPNTLRQFECMNTAAACRTFIALTSEGRKVAAALLI